VFDLGREEIEGRKTLHREACKRVIQTSQKRDRAFRNRLEKEIKEMLSSQNVEGLSDIESFQYLNELEKDMLRSIVFKKSLKGVNFFHDWDKAEGTTQTWYSCVLSQSKRKTGLITYKIQYSLPESDGATTVSNLLAKQFVCGGVLGDLKFLS
jgi:predicted house-cleaning noncanonical NTP pyrophosphatase (MazG superfamily)